MTPTPEPEFMTLDQFIDVQGIVAHAKPIDKNPNMADWMPGMRHWAVTLLRLNTEDNRRLNTYFSQGPALIDEPNAVDVLSCLADDAAGFDNARSFEEWCAEYGYDTDSRKAYRDYQTVQRQTGKLRCFLGADYDTLLYHTERL